MRIDPRVDELRLRHFRSFEDASVSLGDVTFLVGKNGAGKTSILDALDFIAEALTESLEIALERRDGLAGIRQRISRGRPIDVSVAVTFSPPAVYGFTLRSGGARGYTVVEEVFDVVGGGGFRRTADTLNVRRDVLSTSERRSVDSLSGGALFLPHMAHTSSIWDRHLRCLMGFRAYRLIPSVMRAEQPVGPASLLTRDGSNLADVMRFLERQRHSESRRWIIDRLGAIVPGISDVVVHSQGGRRRLEFVQEGAGGRPVTFQAHEVSDGTLRALGVLGALRQPERLSCLLLDEIEDSVHPGAVTVLLDALGASVRRTQIVVTTHSPEVLDHPVATAERVRILEWSKGVSRVHEVSGSAREGLRPPITIGRLLRSNALWPERAHCHAPKDFFSVPQA